MLGLGEKAMKIGLEASHPALGSCGHYHGHDPSPGVHLP